MYNENLGATLAREAAERAKRDLKFHESMLDSEAKRKRAANRKKAAQFREQEDLLTVLRATGGRWLECSRQIKERLGASPAVRDHGHVLRLHPDENRACLNGTNTQFDILLLELLEGLPGFDKFKADLAQVKKASHQQLAENENRAQEVVKENEDIVNSHFDVMNFAEREFSETVRDRTLARQKVKRPINFDEGDPKTWQALPEADASRSRDNSANQQIEIGKKEEQCEKEIRKLEKKVEPLHLEISERRGRLDREDISESEYKTERLEIDFRAAQAERLMIRIQTLHAGKVEFQNQTTDLKHKIAILDCVLDHYALFRDIENWTNRKRRVIRRIQKALTERGELLQLRESLNARWAKLTSDPEPLCAPLCLRADAEIYFL